METATATELVRLNQYQVRANYDEMKSKMCRAVRVGLLDYVKNPIGSGYTATLEEAAVMACSTFAGSGYLGVHYLCEMLDQEFAAEISARKIKYLDLERVFPQVAKMLQAAPVNEAYRAVLMAKIGKMPPPELVTYDQIKDWAESQPPLKEEPIPTPGQPAPAAAPPPRQDMFRVEILVSDTEQGTCRYTQSRTGECNFEFDADDLIDMADDSDDLDQLVIRMMDYVNESNVYDYVDMDTGDDIDYDLYESNDDSPYDTNVEWNTSRTVVRSMVREWLLLHAPPDTLERLGLQNTTAT